MKQFVTGIFGVVRSRVFSKILICYTLLFAILAASCFFSFYQARIAGLEAVTERNELVLENAAKNITNSLQVIESFNGSLYANLKLQSFMSARNEKSIPYDAYVLINEMPTLFDSTSLISGYFVYVPGTGYIITRGQGFSNTNIERYYDDHFALRSSQSYEEWKQEVLTSTKSGFHTGFPETDNVQYVTSLTSRTIGIAPCRVVYRLSGEKLLEMITRSFSSEAQYACLEDENGNILLASSGYTEIANDKNYTRIQSHIESAKLTATIFVPNRLISRQALESISSFITVLIWMMALGLVFIVFTAFANFKPLLGVAKRAEEMGAEAKGMWKITEAFERSEEKSKELLNTLALQKEFLKTACVNRLIHGTGPDGASLEDMLKNAGLSIKGSRFYACMITLGEADAQRHAQALALEVLSRYSDRLTVLALESETVTLALYSETEEEGDNRKTFFTDVHNAILEAANLETAFYVGSVCESLDKLSDSFSAALYLRSSSTADTWLNLAASADEEADLSSILNETEQGQLKSKVLAGDAEGVVEQIRTLETEYFVRRSTHGVRRQYVYCRLVEVLVSCGSSLGVTEELPEDLLLMHSAEFFLWISEKLKLLTEEAGNRLQIKSRQLGEKVFRYIEEHYSDYELTLSALSAHLKVTGPYLSGLFKKQTGTNFSVYLEQVRIRHAEELLKDADISVDELAQKVGYISADSFRRAFKRVKGITPTQYRESM